MSGVEQKMDRLGIAFISALSMPPVQLIEMAARLGCGHVSMALAPMGANPYDFPAWSLRENAALLADVKAAAAGNGVRLSIGEVILIRPGVDVADSASDLDLFAQLGVAGVNALSIDPDGPRGLDQIAAFTQMAEQRGLRPLLEFMPGLPIGSMDSAIAATQHVGDARLKLVVDCMHLARSGGTAADIAQCPPDLIADVQLCDVPLVAVRPNYGDEALHHRLIPGDGELPLADIAGAIPRQATISLEVPMLDRAQAGEEIEVLLGDVITRTKTILEKSRID